MIIWFIAIAITAAACVALFYAGASRAVSPPTSQPAEDAGQFRLILEEIDADLASGKLDEEQGRAAKAELAREMLRVRKEARQGRGGDLGRAPLIGGVVAVAVISLGLYGLVGSPNLPALPLSERPQPQAQNLNLDDAIASIEKRLQQAPDDVRGWTVVAPAYVQLGRYAEAETAYRNVLKLSGETPDLLTSLAEVLMLRSDGEGSEEANDLLRKAAVDPTHARSRLYLAAEAMRAEDYAAAETLWSEAIALADGSEPWLNAARQGLAVAQNDGEVPTSDAQNEMISSMVASLSERLYASGGTVEEWKQLVQSYIVLNDTANAQIAYDAAVVAYPAAFDRGDLDTLAFSAGLKLNGGTR